MNYTQNGLTWDSAFVIALWPAASEVAQANAENRGGCNDWRLPTVAELASIVKYGDPSTATPAGIPGMPAAVFMTSDESLHDFDNNHQSYYFIGVDFNGGFVAPAQKTTPAYVMLVRGALDTKLDWKLSAGLHSWGDTPADAIEGWHVPSPNELLRLPDYSRYPVIPVDHPEMTPAIYWTNADCFFPTLYGQAFNVEFSGGRCEVDIKTAAFPVMLCKASGVVPVTNYTEADVRSWYANVNMAADAAMVLYWMDASNGGPDAFYIAANPNADVKPVPNTPDVVFPMVPNPGGRNVNVYSPAIEVVLSKCINRDTSGKSERYAGGAKQINLKGFLTENSSVTVTRKINAPAGSFQITVGDRGYMHDGTMDSLYGIVEPMDIVEIRMTRTPYTKADKLPLVFRGVISEVRRDESMGQDGKPQRSVVISGQDWGKFLQIIVDKKIRGNPLGTDWLSNQVMQTHFGIPYDIMPSRDLIQQCIEKIANPFIKKFSDTGAIVPFLFDVSGADPADQVMPQGYQANPMNSLWEFMKTYGDLGPFYEMFIDDTEEGPKLVYRKPPFFAGTTNIYGVQFEAVNVEANGVQRLSVSRSDADVANYVWVDHPRIAALTAMDLNLMSFGQDPATLLIDTPNSSKTLYGVRTLELASQHGSILQAANQAPLATSKSSFLAYMKEKLRKLKLANQDNVVLESGTMVVQGNENIKVGRVLVIQRGRFIGTYYATSVTHTFNPFQSFTTTVQFVRGTGFDNRSRNEATGVSNPYLQEIGHGPYEVKTP